MRLDDVEPALVLDDRAVGPVGAEHDDVAALRLLVARRRRSGSRSRRSARRAARARSVIGVSVFGIASVQWWFRFGRRCLQSTVRLSESGRKPESAFGLGESTIRAVTRRVDLVAAPDAARSAESTQVVETWTSPLTRSRSPASIGSSVAGSRRIATRSRAPGLRAIGTAVISSESLPVVASDGLSAARRRLPDAGPASRRARRAPQRRAIGAARRIGLGSTHVP